MFEEYYSWLVYAVILFMVVFLYREILRPTLTFIIAIGVLLLFGVIDPSEALSGFANEQLWVIILLLFISNTLSKTTIVDKVFKSIFKGCKTIRGFMLRMLFGVGVPSAFLNNTPLVAMMMPYVYTWSKDKKVSASRLLIPLSYISILGGCITLIGTSTNLITNGLAVEYGEEALGIFDFAYVGLPMLLIGALYLLIFSKRLLPDNPATIEQTEAREYFVETLVKRGSPLIGKSIADAGLRSLEGLFLVELSRADQRFSVVDPDMTLEEGDSLIFVGDTNRVLDITDPSLGLSLPKETAIPLKEQQEVLEVVLSPRSGLVGKKVKNSGFRSLFNAAILGIHRGGERIPGKVGEIELAAGDAMLILTGSDFLSRLKVRKDLYLVSRVRELRDVPESTAVLLVFGLFLSIVLAVVNLVPLFTSLLVLAAATVLLRMQGTSELVSKIDFELMVFIAMGLALGKAMINSGVAEQLAVNVTAWLEPAGPLWLIAGFFILTNLLSAFMTSKAAVAMVLPVALTTAHKLGLPVEPFILVVAFGGAANFITPVGYQTNLMVYGPGGYSFGDFMKIGLPLTLIYLLMCTFVLTKMYF